MREPPQKRRWLSLRSSSSGSRRTGRVTKARRPSPPPVDSQPWAPSKVFVVFRIPLRATKRRRPRSRVKRPRMTPPESREASGSRVATRKWAWRMSRWLMLRAGTTNGWSFQPLRESCSSTSAPRGPAIRGTATCSRVRNAATRVGPTSSRRNGWVNPSTRVRCSKETTIRSGGMAGDADWPRAVPAESRARASTSPTSDRQALRRTSPRWPWLLRGVMPFARGPILSRAPRVRPGPV